MTHTKKAKNALYSHMHYIQIACNLMVENYSRLWSSLAEKGNCQQFYPGLGTTYFSISHSSDLPRIRRKLISRTMGKNPQNLALKMHAKIKLRASFYSTECMS